jgi:hypothetical protein
MSQLFLQVEILEEVFLEVLSSLQASKTFPSRYDIDDFSFFKLKLVISV